MNRTTVRRRIGALLAFGLPVLLFLSLSLRDGVFAELGPDAELYLSVADNFLSTGHFIQTARETEGFVVPFGLPVLLTLFRALGMSSGAIVALQHALVGGACLLLYLAERERFGAGGFAPAVFCLALLRAHMTPDNIYLEIYFLFLLCLMLWLLSRESLPLGKKLLWLNLAGFCAYAIRTVLLLVWLPILVWTLCAVIRKRFPLERALILAIAFAMILLGNSAMNHRETGEWILTDNYSGESLYIANNPHTRPDYYTSRDLERFVGEEYYAIRDDGTLSQTEKNGAFSAAARRWVGENPLLFIKNTWEKFCFLFLRYWFYAPLLALAGCLASLRGVERGRRRRLLLELGINLALALISSCGLITDRYSLPIWPLASLHLAALAHFGLDWLPTIGKEKRHAS